MFTMTRTNLPGPSPRTPGSPQRVWRGGDGTAALLLLTALLSLAPPVAVRAEVANPQGVAVIVGNRSYDHRDVPNVSFAHRDADAFRRYVVEVLGFDPDNIIDLRDATRRELFDALGTRANPNGLLWSYLDPNGGSEVVLFYSGHGVPSVNDGRGYLLPVDADPKAAQDDGYPIDLLYGNLGALAEARAVQVYLDACFSGESHEGVLVRDASPVYVTPGLPEGVGEKVVSLTAASGEQVASWDTGAQHGLFTHHLLDALHGGGDDDGDGRVTAEEAKGYLDRHMTRAARRQHRRVQVASLAGAKDVVLAASPAGGPFPDRRGPDASDPAPERTVEEPAGDDAPPPLDLAALTGGRAILAVETAPPGVAVLVARVKVGETPLNRFDLRAGTWTVTLEHPTHETVELKEQRLADDEVLRIERELTRATGKVTVITRPLGAWVEQGGERLAETTPVTLDGLPSGPMTLRLGKDGHRTVEIEVAIPKDGVARLERELEEVRHGTLNLELSPPEGSSRAPGCRRSVSARHDPGAGDLPGAGERHGLDDARGDGPPRDRADPARGDPRARAGPGGGRGRSRPRASAEKAGSTRPRGGRVLPRPGGRSLRPPHPRGAPPVPGRTRIRGNGLPDGEVAGRAGGARRVVRLRPATGRGRSHPGRGGARRAGGGIRVQPRLGVQ